MFRQPSVIPLTLASNLASGDLSAFACRTETEKDSANKPIIQSIKSIIELVMSIIILEKKNVSVYVINNTETVKTKTAASFSDADTCRRNLENKGVDKPIEKKHP